MGAMIGMRQTGPILFGLLLLTGCASFDTTREDYVYQEALFLTTREDSGRTDPHKRFNDERGTASYGAAMVAIDPDPFLSSHAVVQPNRILQQDQLIQRRPLQQVQVMDSEYFLQVLGHYAADGQPPGEILLFIHGYKRGFEDAVENAAQLRYQLAFPGPVIAFSWPSTDSVYGYLADMENLEWSIPSLRRMIATIATELPDTRLHIIAHSMGNRALVRVLSDISATMTDTGKCVIDQVVFVAPDFDRAIFMRDVAPLLEDMPFRKTLYVSAEDFPLMASGTLFKYPRLGDSREDPPIVNGVETIDVSDAISFFNGHGYFESERSAIDDLYELIREGKPAPERSGLVEVQIEGGTYWRLLPPK
jgi:esterase/lipase superfamily enzyme